MGGGECVLSGATLTRAEPLTALPRSARSRVSLVARFGKGLRGHTHPLPTDNRNRGSAPRCIGVRGLKSYVHERPASARNAERSSTRRTAPRGERSSRTRLIGEIGGGLPKASFSERPGDRRVPAKLARAQCRAPPERAYSRWEPPSNLSCGCKKARGNALLWLKAQRAGLMRDV